MNRLGFAAALCGFATVALGAFGAHGLKNSFTAESLGWWETATLYALIHSALAIALIGDRALRISGWAFVAGSVVFSGSLYAMALGAPHWLGAITPLGGLAFLAGWALLALWALRET